MITTTYCNENIIMENNWAKLSAAGREQTAIFILAVEK